MILLWKNGGIYSDLDIISLRNFQPFLEPNKNGFGYSSEDGLNNAFMIFPRTHDRFLEYSLNKFVNEYDGTDWCKNGPVLIAKAMREFCNVSQVLDVDLYGFKPAIFGSNNSHQCANLTVFPESYFYPITWLLNEHEDVFRPDSRFDKNLIDKTRNSFAIHLFNLMSRELIARPGDGSFYTEIAQKHCPETYNYVKNNNLGFTS